MKENLKKSICFQFQNENDDVLDSGIIIVDDSFDVDKSRVNEERRAYLEEARSQDASE